MVQYLMDGAFYQRGGRWIGNILILVLTFGLSACSETQLSSPTDPKPILSANIKVVIPDAVEKPANACDVPWGGWIADGAAIEAFEVDSIPCAEFCSARKQLRTCSRGSLSGDASFKFSSCRERGCPSCNYQSPGSNQTHVIPHGDEIQLYSSGNVACGSSCEDIRTTATCNRGNLEGDNLATFNQVSCRPARCTCRAPNPVNPLEMIEYPHGTELAFYTATEVTCMTCEANRILRTCENGVWSGANTHTHRSCVERPCRDCIHPQFPSQTIPHGDAIELFLAQEPLCPTMCRSTTRTCTNGVLQGGRLPDGTNRNTFVWSSCNCACQIPGTNIRVANGSSIRRYTAATAPCGSRLADFEVTISCGQSGLTAIRTGDGQPVNIAGFANWQVEPTVIDQCNCRTPWNTNVPEDGNTLAFNSATAMCETACQSRQFQCRREGTNTMVLIDVLNGQPLNPAVWNQRSCVYSPCRNCTHPQTGAPILHGAAVDLFIEQQPSCPDLCRSTSRMCTNGMLQDGVLPDGSNRNQYVWGTCGCGCTIPGAIPAVTLTSGASIVRYTAETAPCGSRLADYRVNITCNGSSGLSAIREGDGLPMNIANFNNWFVAATQIPVCTCTTPWGAQINENATTPAYEMINATCDQTCSSQTFRCVRDPGDILTLRNVSTNAPIDPLRWRFPSCSRPSCRCTAPWGQVVQHNSQVNAYPASQPVCGSSCSAAAVPIRCNGDTEALTAVNPARPFDPARDRFGFCSDFTCSGLGGNGNGGGEGDGFGRGRYGDDPGGGGGGGPAGPQGCDTVPVPSDPSTVVGIAVSTLYQGTNGCTLPWPVPPPPGIPPEFALGGKIAVGVSVKAFKREEVECNESCEENQVTILCDHDGQLYAPGVPLYPTCHKREDCP